VTSVRCLLEGAEFIFFFLISAADSIVAVRDTDDVVVL